MTKLIENTKNFNDLCKIVEDIAEANTEGVERVIIKLDRNKQIIDAGDCYIVKGDRLSNNQD